MGKSEIVRFRVYELALQLSRQGSGLFQFVASSGLLERLLGELGSLDILVQMNCVEMLLPLMEIKEGLDFLESKGVVAIMYGILLSAQQNPLGAASLIPSRLVLYTGGVCACTVLYCNEYITNFDFRFTLEHLVVLVTDVFRFTLEHLVVVSY